MVSFTYKLGKTKKNNSSSDTFNRLYVFSDSLSDPGNVFNTTKAVDNIFSSIDPRLSGLVPISPPVPPYDSQGKFTNGVPDDPRSIWVDFLADKLNLDGPVVASTLLTVIPDPSFLPPPDPSLPSAAVFNTNTFVVEANLNYGTQTATNSVNFAFAGATSGFDNVANPDPIPPNPPIPGLNPNIPGVLKQIDSFINDVEDLPAEQTSELGDALYAIWGGSNDFDAVSNGSVVDLNGSVLDLNEPVNNLETSVKELYNEVDARNFIVFNLPDLGIRPLVNSPEEAQIFTEATNKYNELLTQRISNLDSELSDISITPIDINSLLEFSIDNPEAFGLTNTEDSFLASSSVDDDPSEYLFWDGEHPTRAVHEITGEFVYQNLQATSNRHDAFILGDSGINILIGGFGNDLLIGGFGNDLLIGGFGNDKLNGGFGNDFLAGGIGDDKLNGGIGDDKLNGSIGDDKLNGGFGNDKLNGGIGNDKLNGGLGKDTYIFGSDILDGQADVDTISWFQTNDMLDFTSYLNAGGTIESTRVSQNLLRVDLINLSNEVEDVVNIFGSQTALSAAEAGLV